MRLTPLIAILLTARCLAVVPPGAPPVHYMPQGPGIRCQVWHNLPGAQITDTLATSDLDRAPDETRQLENMEFDPGFKDGFACVLTGLVTAPTTGAYWFRIASRDSGLLFLSTDESVANRKFIAETPAATNLHDYKFYSAQTSDGIRLVAGQKYLIQAVVKSGPGPGLVSIGWQMPGGVFQGPIPPRYFTPARRIIPPPSLHVNHFKLSLKPDPATQPTTQPTLHPGINEFVRGTDFDVDGKSAEMSYLIYAPPNFNTTSDARPLLVFLHGNNRQGYTLEPLEQSGPVHNIQTTKPLRDWMPMLVLCPQLPPDWRWDTPGAAQAVNALVHQLCLRYPRIDQKRIYLTGLSMGGKGTWLTLENSPQTYAAVVPISAVDVRPDQAPQLLQNLPHLHLACGSEDGGFTAGSHRMFDALKPTLGDRVELTVFPKEGHGVWDHFYPNRSFYEELLKYSR